MSFVAWFVSWCIWLLRYPRRIVMAVKSADPKPANMDALIDKLKSLRKPAASSNSYVLPPAAPCLYTCQLSCAH